MYSPAADPGADRPVVEDPLVELARIVHKNKQLGANVSSGRVETTDYFAGLDDFARDPSPARVEPSFRSPAPVQDIQNVHSAPEPVVPEPVRAEPATTEPARSVEKPTIRVNVSSRPAPVSAAPPRETTAPERSGHAGLSGSIGFSLNREQKPAAPADYPAVEVPSPLSRFDYTEEPAVAPEPSVSDRLEHDLTAEFEDELIGALRQSVDVSSVAQPAGYAATETEPTAEETVASYPGPGAGYSATGHDPQPESGGNDLHSVSERFGSIPYHGPAAQERSYPSERSTPERHEPALQHTGNRFAAEKPEVKPVVREPRRPEIDENDFLAALVPTAEEKGGSSKSLPEEDETNLAGIDALFADLDFPDPVERKTAQDNLFDQPSVRAAAAEDIDDMTWPAAEVSVPRQDEEDTPPPPEGYDLDAVARAMQESDPTLNGAGVLPPHPSSERAAIPKARERSRRGIFVAAGILGVAALGATGFLLYDGDSVPVPSGPPPVIAGLEEPLKVYPEETPKSENSQSSKLIYDRVGNAGAAGPEKLVPTESPKPAELPPAPASAENGAELVPGAPRQVRTVVVRLDDSIPDDGASKAPTAAEPSAPRVVNTSPITPAPESDKPVTVEPVVVANTAEPTVSTPSEAAAPAQGLPATSEPSLLKGAEEAAASAYSDETTPAAPVPTVLPRKKPEAPVRVVSAPVAATPAPAVTQQQNGPLNLSTQASAPASTAPATSSSATSSGSGGYIAPGTYIVQVSSQRSADAASAAYAGLQRKFPGILGNLEAVIVKADVDDRGTFYRARIPTGSRDEAISLCENLKGAGGDCFVRRQP